MITLDQILLLETRVRKTVDRIETLSRENSSLREKLAANERRIGELEVLISTFKEDQGRIEQGILNALEQLDQLEDETDQESEGSDESSADDSQDSSHADFQEPSTSDDNDFQEPSASADDAVDSPGLESREDGDADAGDRDEHSEESRDAELDIF